MKKRIDISRTIINFFFDTLKIKDRKIRGNCNLLIKVNFQKLEWISPLRENYHEKTFKHFLLQRKTIASVK